MKYEPNESNGACGYRMEYPGFPSGALDALFESPLTDEGDVCPICDLSLKACDCRQGSFADKDEFTADELNELDKAAMEGGGDAPDESAAETEDESNA